MSIVVQNIHKKFADFAVLKDINLDVPTGALVSLLGPSGCGKTTLLRIIAGLESSDSGKIILQGQDVTNVSVQKRKIGFMFQNYALFRHMTVYDNIAFGLTVMPRAIRPSKDAIHQKVMELLSLIQLPHLAKSLPHQLSGGQRQRVALARSLAVEPKILLLDEPFGALDAKVRKELRHWLKDIHHALNITSLLVTHDQEEALEISDQVVLMNQGRIEQVGNALSLYEQPQSPFVMQFIGDTQVFEGELRQGAWHYGQFSYPVASLADNASSKAYVHSHGWELATSPFDNTMLKVQLKQAQVLGALWRLTVQDDKHLFEIVVPYLDQQWQAGATLYLRPKKVLVFPSAA